MPEGHTTHRLARDLSRDLVGRRPIEASSPQGRFAKQARILHGSRVSSIEAFGKYLFCRFTGGHLLHVHLGLVGKFRRRRITTKPSVETRLVLATGSHAWHLSGPMRCELIDPEEMDSIIDSLGPDPIRRGVRGERFVGALARTRRSIAKALLDQSVIAGIGNVYRSELCFLVGLHPATPANLVDEKDAWALWRETRIQLRRGVENNKIITVDPRDLKEARPQSRLKRGERLYCYKRDGRQCRRCRARIRQAQFGARTAWWCPQCQPRL